MRKTDTDVKEIVEQVKKILMHPFFQGLVVSVYGVPLKITRSNMGEISTNLSTDVKGTSQLVAQGIGGSLTGKHYDLIFTDDIVNLSDRTSKAERDRTKLIVYELMNIKNRGGRQFNTGTPWHKEDAFTIMPNIHKWDCYSTGIMTEEEIETLCKMVDQGYDFTLIAEKLNRTALATRGKYERLQNPEYNKRYNRGQNDDYEYQGIRSISGKDILKDRKLMDGAEFQELEQVEGGENDGVYMQAMRSTV